MSIHITSDVWKYSQAHGAALLVLISLADQCNDDGECWPRIDQIAARCRISRRSVTRYLAQLVELAELEVEDRAAQGRSNVYRVVLAAQETSQVREPGRPKHLDTPSQPGVPPQANLTPTPSHPCPDPQATLVLTPKPTVARQEPSVEPSVEPSGTTSAAQAQQPTRRGTRLPEGWTPPPDVVVAMQDQFPHVDLRLEHDKFVDFWHAKTGQAATKLDWAGTWRNWIRTAAERARPRGGGRRDIDWDAAAARASARDAAQSVAS